MTAPQMTLRFTRRQILVHALSAGLVLVALIAGAFLGSLTNRAPAHADTTPPAATCVVLCDGDRSGTVGTPGGGGLQVGLPDVDGSGAVGATPAGQQ